MGHRLDRGDVIDMIEESVMRHTPLVVELKNGQMFEDRATDIAKWNGEDHVAFSRHELTPLRRISSCSRAWPLEHTYAGKR